jgi:transposase
MDSRQERGLDIATHARITRKGSRWFVPAENGAGRYTVTLHATSPHCTCPDHETTGRECKHIYAAQWALRWKREDLRNIERVDRDESRGERKTYPQNWRAYNAAQTGEKDMFLDLLFDLSSGVSEPARPKTGRPRIPIQDAIFAACFKVYSTVSCRRFMCDLREAQAKGYLSKLPHFNSIFNYLESAELTPILRSLIAETSLPLKAVETDFAVDSSGFSTSRFTRWFDHKYGVVRQKQDWVKVHLMCGVRTNIVTAVEIKDKNAADTIMLPALVDATARNFEISEVAADKAYGSRANYKAIELHGAVPYIAFKSDHTGKGTGLWQKMFHYFHFRRDEFLGHYHKRSNVESTFSMIKAKFRDHVRSKTDVAMVNEVLCKIICHNICCLIQESHELGIVAEFWPAGETAH